MTSYHLSKQPKLANVGRPSAIKDVQAFKNFVENTMFSQKKNLVTLFEIQFEYAISYNTTISTRHKLGETHKKRVLYKQVYNVGRAL